MTRRSRGRYTLRKWRTKLSTHSAPPRRTVAKPGPTHAIVVMKSQGARHEHAHGARPHGVARRGAL
eukprot:4489994-Prymnesium_polylepis.1